MTRIDPIMKALCPNCGGPISATRLEEGLPCKKCMPTPVYGGPREIGKALLDQGNISSYAWLYDLELQFDDFKAYFEAKTGASLWSAQSSWAKRLLMLDSLAIIAPTGVGKSTLLMVYAAYRVEKDEWRVLYIVPTQNLVKQVYEKLSRLVDGVIYYSGSLSRKKKDEILNKILNKQFKILVITTSFLQRGFEHLKKASPFQLILVDDVDSLLKSGTNVERVLMLMGFDEKTLKIADELVKTRLKLLSILPSGNEQKIRELQSQLAELETKLALETEPPLSQLVIASATGRPRGIKHFMFKELLGFEVGGGSDYMRSVTDTYIITNDYINTIYEIIRKIGKGGIIFVSQLLGKETAKLIATRLERKGVRVALALAGSRKVITQLAEGKVDVVVGVASRYGVIVRGIDLPEVIKYAIFIEIPARKMRIEDALSSPRRLLTLLFVLRDKGIVESKEYIQKLTKLLDKISDIRIVSLAYRGIVEPEGLLKEIVGIMKNASKLVMNKLTKILIKEKVIRINGTVIERGEDGIYLIIPDAPTYLQASGRTSRLFRGVMTHGLSIVLSRSKERVEALEERLKWFTSSSMINFDNISIKEILKKIDQSRKGRGKKVNVKTVLLIVESPTKARTIAWFWGRPGKRRLGRLTIYETSVVDPDTGTVYLLMVTASRGHLMELATDEDDSVYGVKTDDRLYRPVYTSIKRCMNCGYTFAAEGVCPRCGSRKIFNSMNIINILRKLSVEVDEIIIATDPDREGEKIAWDIYLALKPYNANIRRGRFHEVTRRAVLEALKNSGPIDKRLVMAQIVRRIEDRWIGFSLSKHLWAKYGKRWLGAGRVQTPVLGWTVDRYVEWKQNMGYNIILHDTKINEYLYVFVRERPSWKKGETVEAIVVEKEEWIEEVNPPPPMTTDDLLYEASRRYGLSASQTMKIAQDLFESGLITYHRTDSTRVSSKGMGIAKSYLEQIGIAEYYHPRSWGEGGAHEAIRPTKPLDVDMLRRGILEGSIRVQAKLTWAHFKIYDLIFRRFIASQMSPDKVKKARVKIKIGDIYIEKESIVTFESKGFTYVLKPRINGIIKHYNINNKISLKIVKIVRGSSIRLYRVGDLVKLMKEGGIGRPSTYAKAIEANRRHGYIIFSKKKQYVIPTKTGITIYNYLKSNFAELISVETSRRMEKMLDEIAEGKLDPAEALSSVASMIHGVIDDVQIRKAVSAV